MAARLPGMEDAQIEELETMADSYKRVQRRRMKALTEEIDLKEKILALMKTNRKKIYRYGGLSIEIVPTREKISINKDSEEEVEIESDAE